MMKKRQKHLRDQRRKNRNNPPLKNIDFTLAHLAGLTALTFSIGSMIIEIETEQPDPKDIEDVQDIPAEIISSKIKGNGKTKTK